MTLDTKSYKKKTTPNMGIVNVDINKRILRCEKMY